MVLGAFKKYVFGPRREAQREAAEAKRRAEDAEKAGREAKRRSGGLGGLVRAPSKCQGAWQAV